MQRPDLKPRRFIKICYEEENDLRFSIAFTHQCYGKQTWMMALKAIPAEETHCDASLLHRRRTKVDWDLVVSWDYVDFNDLLLQIKDEEIIEKYGINDVIFKT